MRGITVWCRLLGVEHTVIERVKLAADDGGRCWSRMCFRTATSDRGAVGAGDAARATTGGRAVAVAHLLLSHHCIKPRPDVTDEHVVCALAKVLAVTLPRSDHGGQWVS